MASLLSRRGALAGLLATAAAVGLPGAANAQEEQPVSANVVSSNIYSRGEAFRVSTGRIILHYGGEIKGINIEIQGLRNRGYPALAVAGGSPDKIEIFVDRVKIGFYTQNDLYSGVVGAFSQKFYDERIGKPTSGPLVDGF